MIKTSLTLFKKSKNSHTRADASGGRRAGPTLRLSSSAD